MNTDSTIDSVLEALRQQGCRMTKTRQAVLDLFFDQDIPVDVMKIQDFLHQQGLAIHKTTIYREIDFLLQKGIIHEVSFGNEKAFYELAHRTHHHHIRCVECNTIVDVHIPDELHSATRHITQQTQFTVIDHSLEFMGLCPVCQQKQG